MTEQEKLGRLVQHGFTNNQAIQTMRMDEDGTLGDSAIAAKYRDVVKRYQSGGKIKAGSGELDKKVAARKASLKPMEKELEAKYKAESDSLTKKFKAELNAAVDRNSRISVNSRRADAFRKLLKSKR